MQEIFKNITFQDETTKDKVLHLINKLPPGDGNIDIDITDVKTILESKGVIDVKILHSISIKAFVDELECISNVYKDKKVQGALALYEIPAEAKLDTLMLGFDKLDELASEDATIIFGTSIQNNFKDDEIKATLLISIDLDISIQKENKRKKQL